MRIQGKIVLITGASQGIGAACGRVFEARGAKLSLLARNAQALALVGDETTLRTAGDVTDPEVRQRAVDATIDRFGRIDILINNAGAGLVLPSAEAPLADVRRMFELNLFALLGMIQLAIPHMQRQGGGSIVNIGSMAGKVTLPWLTIYSASKYAVGSLTDGLRMELKRDGIHAMTVCPGYVRTAFFRNVIAGAAPSSMGGDKLFSIDAETCAEAIARGVERKARTVVTPGIGWLFVLMERIFPALVDHRLMKIYDNSRQA